MKTTQNMRKALLLRAWPTGYKKGQHRRNAVLSVAAALFLISLLPSPVSATMGQLIITTDTTLTENHFGNLIIGADNITLDCAGFSVDGTGLGISNGIALSGRQGVTVKNCQVTGFIHGFFLNDFCFANTFTMNTATGNTLTGFFVFQSSRNHFTMNTATGNDQDGFFLFFTDDNILTMNTAPDNDRIGFFVGNASGNILMDNTANGNDSHGFFLSAATGNTLTRNTATGNVIEGFFLVSSDGNTLRLNKATDNGEGIRIDPALERRATQLGIEAFAAFRRHLGRALRIQDRLAALEQESSSAWTVI